MDCQTCNDLLLDLAYGELDEVRAAAARKHMDSCGECRESFARVSRGRSLAKHIARDDAPPVSQSLRAAIEAQAARFAEAAAAAGASAVPAGSGGDASRDSNVVPFAPRDGRVSRWFERVGELAMRRQVAMAAVFLIMIGVGLIFYQSHPRPTDAQDDRTPDVVPAVEISPSNGSQAGAGRLPSTGNLPPSRDRDDRARLANNQNAMAARPDPGLRERAQANAHSGTSAGSAAEPANVEALAREAEAERSVAEAQAQNAALAAQQTAPLRDQQAQGQQMQAAPPAAHYAQPSRQLAQTDSPQPSPAAVAPVAQVAPVAPAPLQQQVAMGRSGSTYATTPAAANDTIARLQAELAAASDEATRARLRNQLIAAYEQRGMYAEANTLRSQSAEPANAASNSMNNAAGASAGIAQTQAPAAASQNFESPTSTGASSTRSTTHRSIMRRPAPSRSGSRSDAYDAMGL